MHRRLRSWRSWNICARASSSCSTRNGSRLTCNSLAGSKFRGAIICGCCGEQSIGRQRSVKSETASALSGRLKAVGNRAFSRRVWVIRPGLGTLRCHENLAPPISAAEIQTVEMHSHRRRLVLACHCLSVVGGERPEATSRSANICCQFWFTAGGTVPVRDLRPVWFRTFLKARPPPEPWLQIDSGGI